MGTPFKLYQVSLKYFYSLLASDNQSIIGKAFQYLEKDFGSWDVDVSEAVIPTYQRHLHNLIVEGELYNSDSLFPIPREYKGDDSDGDLDVNPAMLTDVIEAIFSTHPSFASYGQTSVYNYNPVLRYLMDYAPQGSDVAQLYKFLLVGRPILGERVNKAWRYTHLRNKELPLLLENLATYHIDGVIEATKKTLEETLAHAYITPANTVSEESLSAEHLKWHREIEHSKYTNTSWSEPKYVKFFDVIYTFEYAINEIYKSGYGFFARADS